LAAGAGWALRLGSGAELAGDIRSSKAEKFFAAGAAAGAAAAGAGVGSGAGGASLMKGMGAAGAAWGAGELKLENPPPNCPGAGACWNDCCFGAGELNASNPPALPAEELPNASKPPVEC
jgi:hypothetical protein